MIEALLCSVDEPQLDRCLESIRNQTVPFSNVVHINNVAPYCDAYNRGLSMLKDKWFMLLAGDMYLHPDAVEKVIMEIERETDDRVIAHLHGVWDAFLQEDSVGIGTFRTDILKTTPFRNRLSCERYMGRKLDGNGWIFKRHESSPLGVHCDSPDEYQTFRRFYVMGVKFRGNVLDEIYGHVFDLFDETNNPLYSLAIKAMDFGRSNREYPGSHDINFEKKKWEEFSAISKEQSCS